MKPSWKFTSFCCVVVLTTFFGLKITQNTGIYRYDKDLKLVTQTLEIYTTEQEAGNQSWKQKLTLQELRIHHLQTECNFMFKDLDSEGTLPEFALKQHMIYDPNTHLVFCDLPKVGSTFLKQVLHIIMGHRNLKNPFEITGNDAHAIPFLTFSSLDFGRIHKILSNSTKFLFVRNPYARVLSGYVDKIYTNNLVYWDSIGKTVIKMFRQNATKKSLNCGHDVTFKEFVQFIVHSEETKTHRNPHWYPMYDSCRPCSINYDFLGKMESFQSDLHLFLETTNFSSKVDISTMNMGNEQEAISLTTFRAFDASEKRPDCINRIEALTRAWRILQIRGLIPHSEQFPKFQGNITQNLFISMVNKSIKKFPLTQKEKSTLKEQAITTAYQSIPKALMDKFLKIYNPDFSLFGYGKRLPEKKTKFSSWKPFL